MAVDTICSDLEAQENKVCHCFYCFPIYLPWMGPDAMILVFWMLSFKPVFFTLLFHLIKKFFSSSSLSAIRVVSSAYLRLLIFLPAILILACASSILALLLRYSAYWLNKQGDNIQPWRTLFPILNSILLSQFCYLKSKESWDFPGDPVVKTLSFHFSGCQFDSWLGN